MADVTSTLNSWSSTSSNNLPANSASVGPNTLADNQRTIQAVVRAALAGDGTIASATTTDLSTVNDGDITVTGTTTITGFGTLTAGIKKILTFSGALTLTHNATSLILPGAANITTAAGDVAIMRSLGSGNWKCVAFQPAAGNAKVGANADITSLTGLTTALSVAQGGTASTTAAAARTALSAAASGANADITSLTAVTSISATGGTAVKGTNTNDSAAAGYVGEYTSNSRLVASALALTTGTSATITTLSLTAGDWDVSGQVGFVTATSSTSVIRIIAETTTSTIHSGSDGVGVAALVYPGGAALNSGGNGSVVINTGVRRFSLSATTTVNLLAYSDFSTAGLSAFGSIKARRVR